MSFLSGVGHSIIGVVKTGVNVAAHQVGIGPVFSASGSGDSGASQGNMRVVIDFAPGTAVDQVAQGIAALTGMYLMGVNHQSLSAAYSLADDSKGSKAAANENAIISSYGLSQTGGAILHYNYGTSLALPSFDTGSAGNSLTQVVNAAIAAATNAGTAAQAAGVVVRPIGTAPAGTPGSGLSMPLLFGGGLAVVVLLFVLLRR